MRGFLGLAGYYKRLIQGFVMIYKSLTKLSHKDSFKWSSQASKAFEKLKTALKMLMHWPYLYITKTFMVEIDNSGYGSGVILM